ncbi:spore coat protein U domain-containing protein [Neisseria sicca]|nr:spore coat protein U domain-containing protein [Neisseria sicca]
MNTGQRFPFVVQAHVAPVCEFISADDIDFGTHTAGSTDLKQSGNLTVRCTNGTPYTVGLIPSNGNQEGSGEMKSTNPANTDKVPYRLKKGTNTNAHLWGNQPSGTGSWQKATGDGSSKTYTVAAEVKNTDYTPGEYQDKVTVDIRY